MSMETTTQATPHPQPDERTGGLIVVGVDGSRSSVAALRRAGQLAEVLDCSLDVVNVWSNSVTTSPIPLTWSPSESARAVATDAMMHAFGAPERDNTRVLIGEGSPSRVLIEHSRDARMLVLGRRGHGGITGLLLGSVALQCVRHASCPVLIEQSV